MGLETKLSLKQTQKLVMTAMLQQAIMLLPITDQQLVECLAAESVKIARRTVTKYRRELHLPPANRRKQSNEVQM
jgi:DNA-directed RNA polymerase specialized sigma54-like protein